MVVDVIRVREGIHTDADAGCGGLILNIAGVHVENVEGIIIVVIIVDAGAFTITLTFTLAIAIIYASV